MNRIWKMCIVGLALACSPATPAPSSPTERSAQTKAVLAPSPSVAESTPLMKRFAAEVALGSVGPRLVPTASGWTLVWASPAEQDYQLFTTTVSSAGSQLEVHEPRAVALLGGHVSHLLAEPNAQGEISVLSLQARDATDELSLVQLGAGGELVAPPRRLRSSPDRLVWAQIHQDRTNSGQSLVFWAEQSKHTADLYVSSLRATSQGTPLRLESKCVAWQVTPYLGQVVLATVCKSATVSKSAAASSSATLAHHYDLKVRLLDASGEQSAEPVVVASLAAGGLDLDVVAMDKRLVLAWSEPKAERSQLRVAFLDLQSKQVEVRDATPPRGDQGLVRLLGSAEKLRVIWQEPLLALAQSRDLWLGEISRENPAAEYPVVPLGQWQQLIDDAVLPLFVEAKEQLFMMGQAEFCPEKAGLGCDAATSRRFFSSLQPDQEGSAQLLSELMGQVQVGMAWDLNCPPGKQTHCYALVSDAGLPAQVYLVEFDAAKASPWRAPYVPIKESIAHLLSRETLVEVPELSALSAERFKGNTLLAWLSYFDANEPEPVPARPAPDGKLAPVRAHLHTEMIKSDPQLHGQKPDSSTISVRARSLGGVDVAMNEKSGLLVWSALDEKDPQLFATSLNALGKKSGQKMLTRTKGEVFDVSVSAVGDGYVITWIDGASGGEEVWAMWVDERLNPSVPLQISHSARAPTEVASQVVGQQLIVMWVEAHSEQAEERSDLRVAVVDLKATRVLIPGQVFWEGQGVAHSPQLGAITGADGAIEQLVGAFIELSPPAGGTLRTFALPLGGPSKSPGFDHLKFEALAVPEVGAFSLDCAKQCRLALATKSRDVQALWLAELGPEGAEVMRLMNLGGSSPAAAVPFLAGDELFFADQLSTGAAYHLYRATLDWAGE